MSGMRISDSVRVAMNVAHDVASAAVVRAYDSLPETRVQETAAQVLSFLRGYLAALIIRQREENYVLTNCSIQTGVEGELPYNWMMVHGPSVPIEVA